MCPLFGGFTVCAPDRDQRGSLLCIFSFFLFNIGIVHHFDMVNHLDMMETWHMRTPSMCSCSPASSFPGLQKAGQGPGNKAMHSLDLTSLVDSWAQDYSRTSEQRTGLLSFVRRLSLSRRFNYESSNNVLIII